MATDALTQAIIQGLDPGVYQPLSNIRQGEALQAVGQDASPTSKWGALGRLANAAAGTYLANSATSDLARTIAGGKKSAQDQLLAAIEAQQNAAKPAPVPMAAPAQAAPPTAPLQPAVQPSVPSAAGSPNAQVANRFPADWSPGTAASPLPNDAPSPLDTAQSPAGPNAAATAVAANAPRGVRNNNPLNIEAGDFTKSQPGFSGSDGRFAKFDTPQNGLAAAHALLDVYDTKHGLNTVNGIVGRWAPGTDGNNVSAYASDVAQRLGIDPNAPIPKEMRPALVAAMAQHENGVPVPGADQAPYKVAGPPVAAPRAAAPAADDDEGPAAAAAPAGLDTHKLLAVLQNPYSDDATKQLAQKLLLQQLTPKEHEFASSPQGIFDKTTGELKKGGATDFGGLQGKDLLTAVQQQNPAMASQAQAVLEGRVPYPSGSRLNPQQQQLKELVTQIDPNFTAANSKVMQDTLQDYGTKGRTGQARVAANTMLGHADTLDKLVDKLGNYNYFPSVMNPIHNAVAGETDPEYQKTRGTFELTKTALATEAEKALAGHTTVSGIKTLTDDISRAKSPEELHSAIHGLVHVLGSRLDSMASGFDTSMHTRTQGHEFLDPKGREIFNRFEGVNAPASSDVGRIPAMEGAEPAPAAAASTPAVPAVGTVMKGHKFLGGDPSSPSSWQAVQ